MTTLVQLIVDGIIYIAFTDIVPDSKMFKPVIVFIFWVTVSRWLLSVADSILYSTCINYQYYTLQYTSVVSVIVRC